MFQGLGHMFQGLGHMFQALKRIFQALQYEIGTTKNNSSYNHIRL